MTSREHIAGQKRRFDISWFIPALVKYRKPLRDVLVGSFFLKLIGLTTPVFFQLVIDKALVHQSLTTLQVLAIGLATVLVFETILSALRTRLFAHTTNRVDAELSAALFRHLVALPLSYFEARRVGDSVARVRELENFRNFRNFLTSNAVTVVIDLFFTIVFVWDIDKEISGRICEGVLASPGAYRTPRSTVSESKWRPRNLETIAIQPPTACSQALVPLVTDWVQRPLRARTQRGR